MQFDQVIVTCEHASNDVPREFRASLGEDAKRLGTHFSYDLGAKQIARALARELKTPLVLGTVSRLLVDLNRTSQHPRVLGATVRDAEPALRRGLLSQFHEPYWRSVRKTAEKVVRQRGRVLHLAIHSFTPELNGVVRTADIGLLYDPARALERALCTSWQRELSANFLVRRNYPYRGVSDGLVTHLRKRFAAARYVGLEIEVNQAQTVRPGFERVIARQLSASLRAVLSRSDSGAVAAGARR